MSNRKDINITTVFHVHLPFDTNSYNPTVLGNCETLGYWKKPKVFLRQIPNSTLWVSDPVHISATPYVEYKYCLVSPWIHSLNFEGGYDRRLIHRGNIYEVWSDSEDFQKNKASSEDYAFVDYIYKTINSSDNLKNGIIDYQHILSTHREEFKKIVGFITQNLSTSKTKEQVLFSHVLLGHYMDQQRGWSHKPSLPNEFPSSFVIKEFNSIDDYSNLPSNAERMVVKAFSALIQHNSKHGFLDWITIFAPASKFDTSYSFIDSIEIYDYKRRPGQFIKLLKEIKPIINYLEDSNLNALNKTMNKVIKMSYSVECLVHLQENFEDLENKTFLHEIRKKLLGLVNDKQLYWNDENIFSLHRLLKEPNLGWQNREYASVLKAIAESNHIIVLESFPEIYKFILGLNLGTSFNQTIKKGLEQESIKWFTNICRQRSSAYDIFRYLSSMYSTSTHGQEILNKLLSHNIVMSLPDDSIFSITSRITDFHEDIITHFTTLVKNKVRPLVQVPDERLLKMIMQICNSTTSLNIRNYICEEILCDILGHLQQVKDVRFSEIESFQLLSFQFAKFWMTIFKAKGCKQKLFSHPYFKETRETVIHLAMNIRDRTITIRFLQKIFKYFINDNRGLKDYLNCAIENYPGEYDIITDEIIEEYYNQCCKYNSTLERLQKFYEKFCSPQLVLDVKQYFDDLVKRLNDATLKESYVKDHWSMHAMTIEIMENYYYLVDSRTFYNVFRNALKAELIVEQAMNELFKVAVEDYKTMCIEYDQWEKIKCTVANEFWKNINVEHVDKEINFMTPYFNRFNNAYKIQELIKSLKFLVIISSTLERLHQLLAVIKALKLDIISCDQDFWVEELIHTLEDKELLLCQLEKTFDQFDKNEKMSSLTNDVWSVIEEICSAIGFVIFLKSLVGHNLKNLINGVDDHSDERLIQENTVQTFIQVKQILEPLFEEKKGDNKSKHSMVQGFLQILCGIVKKNPSLASKLRLCNANAQALKNICKNIYNRGEMTKEKIFYSVTKGVYLFKKMNDDENRYTATLSYSSEISPDSIANYTFENLQDLRGRALLIAKAPTNTKAFINEETSDAENIKANEITLEHMNKFVIRVDLAQEIIDAASSLKELGHFKYRDFQASTHTTQEMENLLKILLDDLQNWETIVNEAQQNHYYLTFFLAQHILNFYDYFSYNENITTTQLNIKEKCSMLLRYVNDKAELPDINSDILEIMENYYYL
ncbi:9166_t:CDS:2, partial [Racocetra fulgida]